jgi:hypothetical protein
MLTVNKRMVMNNKIHICPHCNSGFSTPQGKSRHINHNGKCLKLRAEKTAEATTTPLTPTPSNSNDEITQLKLKLSLLENGETPTDREIRILKEQLEAKDLQIAEMEKDIAKFKPFYAKHMTTGSESIEHYDPVKMRSEFEEFLCNRYDEGRLDVTKHMVYGIHSFFVPKYYKMIDIKESIYKYRDSNNELIIDDRLKRLHNIVKPVFTYITGMILSDLRYAQKDTTEIEKCYDKLIIDDDSNSMDFFNRMVTIDDPRLTKIRRSDYQQFSDMMGTY